MSFTVKLMKNTSPANYLDKSLTDVMSVTGTLREPTSILSPMITIETSEAADVIYNVNYLYIANFGRYYFVDEIESDYNGLWRFMCHVDVLTTYKTQIRTQNAIVARNANQFNSYLDDGSFMAYSDPIIDVMDFSQPNPFEHEEFVLTVAGS